MRIPALIRALALDFDDAGSLDEALNAVAVRVRAVTVSELTAIYLVDGSNRALRKRALAGAADAPRDTGLLSACAVLSEKVAARREPVSVDDLRSDRARSTMPECADCRGSLLAVPLIHRGETVGVIALASASPSHFHTDTVDFLLTAAARISGRVSRAVVREDVGGALVEVDPVSVSYSGAASSPGFGIGQICLVGKRELADVPDRKALDVEAELVSIQTAVAAARRELEGFQAAETFGILDSETRAIFDVYHQLLGEQGLVDEISQRIRAGNWARGALRSVIEEKAAVFERLEDSYLRARAEDFREIGRRILQHLEAPDGEPRVYPEHCVLAGEEVGIVEIARVPPARLRGLVSRRGSVLSHAAVLARALNIPAVMGLSDLPLSDLEGCEVVVDGHQGTLVLAPTAEILAGYHAVQDEESRLAERLGRLSGKPAISKDGVRVAMMAKAGMLADLHPVSAPEIEGIGLYRTEFAFMLRSSFPSEKEQTQTYRNVLETMAPRPVTMRTLDAGGDKALPYFTVVERNPFLGWRGIRMSLDHPELFLTQVRSMLKANAGFGNLRIMFPMVASVGELDEALALLRQAARELIEEGEQLAYYQVGLMIEVPSAIYLIEALAKRVDFFSIGTNDLVQYLLAVDRDNAHVANRYDTLHPAVVNALNEICVRAHRSGVPVGVCGEMAGEVEAALLFLGMGVAELSASPSRLPFIRALVRGMSSTQARTILERALPLETGAAIRQMLRKELANAGLDELISAHVPASSELETSA